MSTPAERELPQHGRSNPAHFAVPEIPDVPVYRLFERIVAGWWTQAAYRSWRRRRPLGRIERDLRVRVAGIAEEGTDVRALRLERLDGTELPAWDPGAHVDVVMPSGRMRQYSLTSDPTDLTAYRIAVRRIDRADGGGGGSVEMHSLRAGDELTLKGPRNAFPFIGSPNGYLFVAGGIGITPILPMLREAVRDEMPYAVVYTGRSRATMPFVEELADLVGDERLHLWPDDEYGVPDAAAIIDLAPPGAALYACGPMPMVDAIRRAIPDPHIDRLHYERFSPPPVVGGDPFTIHLADEDVGVRVAADESALTAVRRVRPRQPYSCQQGFCGTCRVRVLAGEVDHRDHVLTEDERDGHMMLCVSRAKKPTDTTADNAADNVLVIDG